MDDHHEIKDLIEADREFENGEGIRFASLDELDSYLDGLCGDMDI